MVIPCFNVTRRLHQLLIADGYICDLDRGGLAQRVDDPAMHVEAVLDTLIFELTEAITINQMDH